MKAAILLALALLATGCNEPAEQALRAQGYKSFQLGGPVLLSCGRDDSSATSREFTAVRQDGTQVSGVVCCGLVFKGCTVRF